MKKLLITNLTLLALLTFSEQIFTQVTGISSAGTRYEMVFVPGQQEDNSDLYKDIAHKMYLTEAYLPAKVNVFSEVVYLRYNMFKDEMEFMKDSKILFLKKQEKTTVTFNNSNEKYGVFNLDDKLKYFQIQNTGDILLLTRKVVEFHEAKPAQSSYQKDKPADLKREDDIHYIKFEDNSIVEIPSRQKNFLAIFKNNSNAVKKFIKENKINIKDVEDLKKVVKYLNTL